MRTPNLNFIYVKQRACAPLGRTIYELLGANCEAELHITSISELAKYKTKQLALDLV